jgi:hypothetical protein
VANDGRVVIRRIFKLIGNPTYRREKLKAL